MDGYITTYTKIHMQPLKPKTEDISVEDIAHALSLMTRANGHFPKFYSVAQHCLHCYEEAKARGANRTTMLACLLHDASEAYLADITRPVKQYLPKYLEIEEGLQNAIYNKYLGDSVSVENLKWVKEIDDALLYHEFQFYMHEKLMEDEPILKSNPVFQLEDMKCVEARFLEVFNELYEGIK